MPDSHCKNFTIATASWWCARRKPLISTWFLRAFIGVIGQSPSTISTSLAAISIDKACGRLAGSISTASPAHNANKSVNSASGFTAISWSITGANRSPSPSKVNPWSQSKKAKHRLTGVHGKSAPRILTSQFTASTRLNSAACRFCCRKSSASACNFSATVWPATASSMRHADGAGITGWLCHMASTGLVSRAISWPLALLMLSA